MLSLRVSDVSKCLAFIFCTVVSVSVYMRYTYLLEYTTLADLFRPMSRRNCYIPTLASTGSNSPSEMEKSLKIGIIMIFESTDHLKKAWSDELLEPLVNNKQSYCNRHSYTLIDANTNLNFSRAASWSKLLALEHHFKFGGYDYLFYLDMDTIIMNPTIKLETFIDASARQYDVLLTEDTNGLNAGVFLMRNSPWTLWFLRTAWEQEQLVPKTAPDGRPYPFRWEQRAFHYLTDSKVWQHSGFPRYPGNSSEIRSHFYVLPQCAFNSYILHPLALHENREASQYVPGDFLVHFAGKTGDSKKLLMNYFFDMLGESNGTKKMRRNRLR
jgi:hypothetical protein